MIYVASPYSHRDPAIREHRFQMVEKYIVSELRQKMVAFSPIVYAHKMAVEFGLPTDAEYWKGFNNSIMRRCDSIVILRLKGWDRSKGVEYERQLAEELHMPVNYANPVLEVYPEGIIL
jgi:hypothetical protein